MKAPQVFGAIILVGLFVMTLLYILTSQMISSAVMVQQQVNQAPPAMPPTVSAQPIAIAMPILRRDWYVIRYDYELGRYRITGQSVAFPWRSCDDGLAEMLAALPELEAGLINGFCKKYASDGLN